jgi:hypothetical protein
MTEPTNVPSEAPAGEPLVITAESLNAGPSAEGPSSVDGVAVGRLSVEVQREAPEVPDTLDDLVANEPPPSSDGPLNKGARPLHELRELGLVDPEVDKHVKEFQRSYTQSKQDASAVRKELDALKAERAQLKQEREALLGAVNSDRENILTNDFMSRLPELAAQEVDEASLYTREGMERLAEIKAAKLLQQFTEPLKAQQAQYAQQQKAEAARADKLAFVEANPWVKSDPDIRARAAALIGEGMDLKAAAFQASHEVQQARAMQSQTLRDQQRQARREALRATAQGSLLHSGKSPEDMTSLEEWKYWREVEQNGGVIPAVTFKK